MSRKSVGNARSDLPQRGDHKFGGWSIRRYRVGALNGPAYVEFEFPTEGGGRSRVCVPASGLRHPNLLLDQLADMLPIFPKKVAATDDDQKRFVRDLVSAAGAALELVPTKTGFIDRRTFVTHGEIIQADGARTPRPRLPADVPGRTFIDVKGTPIGAKESVLRLAQYSTYLAFVVGVEFAACLPSYVELWRDEHDSTGALLSETAVFNLSGASSSGKSSAGLAAISLAGSPHRAGGFDFSRRGLAELASDSNDLAFLLDDTEKAEDGPGVFVKTLKSVVQMVPGGRSKMISRGVDQTRFPQLQWTAFGLTSSPRALRKLAAESHWNLSPGEMARLFDIGVPPPKEGGIWDRIPGDLDERVKRGIKLIAELQRGYTGHTGHTIALWAAHLMKKNRTKRVKQLVDRFIKRVKAGDNGWEIRFATKFALIYAALRMATDAELLPWPKRLAWRVAAKCYRKARRAADKPEQRLQRTLGELQRLMTLPGLTVDESMDRTPVQITDQTVAIRYRRDRRVKLGILDQALMQVAGSKKVKRALTRQLSDAGVFGSGHGHAGTREERIASVRNGKFAKRTRLWIVDLHRLNELVKKLG